MPGFLTHWRTLIETARLSQDAGSDLGSLIIDASALRRRAHGWTTPPQTTATGAVWDTGPLPKINFSFPGSDISAMAFMGALAPDTWSFASADSRAASTDALLRYSLNTQSPDFTLSNPLQWSRLFHCNRTGDLLITFLEQIALVPSPALRSQALAFALGYVSHIATDIALNPWVDGLVALTTSHIHSAPGPHSYVETRLDEYLAATYFHHPRYRWTRQPWIHYLEPVISYFTRPHTPAAQILHLLANTAEITYQLQEEHVAALKQDFLQGLDGLRAFLSGHGRFRGLTLRAALRSRQPDTLAWAIEAPAHFQTTGEEITLKKALTYATLLSTRLCRRALAYYSALRNTHASASERSSRRASLCNDLRNWNLLTGYNLEVELEPTITLHYRHNWRHFSELWDRELERENENAFPH